MRNFHVALLSLSLLPVLAAAASPSPRALLDEAADKVFEAPYVTRVDTSETRSTLVSGTQRRDVPAQRHEVTIEIDRAARLARESTRLNGAAVVLLKQGDATAMWTAADGWHAPEGPFKTAAAQLGDLFVCETLAPETPQNAPPWRVLGNRVLDGRAAIVIDANGGNTIPLAQARIDKGLAQMIADPAQRPNVKVLAYHSTNWLDARDHRRLMVVQISRTLTTLPHPGGEPQMVESNSTTTSRYRYDKVTIAVPPEAERVLAGAAPAESSSPAATASSTP